MVDNVDVPYSGYPYNTQTILLMLIYPILHILTIGNQWLIMLIYPILHVLTRRMSII